MFANGLMLVQMTKTFVMFLKLIFIYLFIVKFMD